MRWIALLLVVGCSASAHDTRRPGPGASGGGDEDRGPLRLDPRPPGAREQLVRRIKALTAAPPCGLTSSAKRAQ